MLADQRRRKREELLAATEKELERIAAEVKRRTRTPLTADQIGVKLGRVLHRYKVGKHFATKMGDGLFAWSRREESIQREAALDGLYVIRSSEKKARLSAADTVRCYKSLAQVERAFRCLKGVDLRLRPIFHRTPERVRAHIFLCLLAYYVEWHMRRDLAPLLFADEQLEADRPLRDAVAAAQPSAATKKKKATHHSTDGLPLHSFRTLLDALATRCQNTCRVAGNEPQRHLRATHRRHAAAATRLRATRPVARTANLPPLPFCRGINTLPPAAAWNFGLVYRGNAATSTAWWRTLSGCRLEIPLDAWAVRPDNPAETSDKTHRSRGASS